MHTCTHIHTYPHMHTSTGKMPDEDSERAEHFQVKAKDLQLRPVPGKPSV